jgi:ribonuclease HI
MRVFTDGACPQNGRRGAKAGWAAWFPEAQALSASGRVPDDQAQTNQRAELLAIQQAVTILEQAGHLDANLVVYTDSQYCIDCLTKWITGWVARGWKKADGGDVLHRDLIEDISTRLTKFKSHRFVHVRAHTGGKDDLAVQNDRVDRMARGTVEDVPVRTIEAPAEDALFEGCPLRLLGPPVSNASLVTWVRANLDKLDTDLVDKHLMKAFAEACKARDVTLTKQTIQRQAMLRAERFHLQPSVIVVEKVDA